MVAPGENDESQRTTRNPAKDTEPSPPDHQRCGEGNSPAQYGDRLKRVGDKIVSDSDFGTLGR